MNYIRVSFRGRLPVELAMDRFTGVLADALKREFPGADTEITWGSDPGQWETPPERLAYRVSTAPSDAEADHQRVWAVIDGTWDDFRASGYIA